jgi:hypothetical protein
MVRPLVPAGPGARYRISFDNKDGAMLCLYDHAEVQSIRNQDATARRYVARHAQQWLSILQEETISDDVELHDLLFITGTVKAKKWETWTFQGSSRDISISGQVGTPQMLDLSANYSCSYCLSASPIHAWGPRSFRGAVYRRPVTDSVVNASSVTAASTTSVSHHDGSTLEAPGREDPNTRNDGAVDQCICISAFKVKEPLSQRLLRKLRAGAKPKDPDSDNDEDADTTMGLNKEMSDINAIHVWVSSNFFLIPYLRLSALPLAPFGRAPRLYSRGIDFQLLS